jgi:hypothetical protein
MVGTYALSVETEEIEYDVIKPQYVSWFERVIMNWYQEFGRLTPKYLPTVVDILDDSLHPIGGTASEAFALLEQSVQVEFCGIDTFPEDLGNWTDDHYLYFEDQVDLTDYEVDLFKDIEKLLETKGLTYSRYNPETAQVSSVIEVW